jgi:hypothetical protein
MTDPPITVVVSYARFLEYRDLRARVAAELTRRDQPPAIDGEVVPVPPTSHPLTAHTADH